MSAFAADAAGRGRTYCVPATGSGCAVRDHSPGVARPRRLHEAQRIPQRAAPCFQRARCGHIQVWISAVKHTFSVNLNCWKPGVALPDTCVGESRFASVLVKAAEWGGFPSCVPAARRPPRFCWCWAHAACPSPCWSERGQRPRETACPVSAAFFFT